LLYSDLPRAAEAARRFALCEAQGRGMAGRNDGYLSVA